MRKGVPAAALAICAAALIAARMSAGPAGPSADSTRAEVRKWIEKGNAEWVEGFQRADAAMVVAGFASDAVNVGKDGTVDVGREAIQERTRKYMETSGPAKTARADIADLVVSGNLETCRSKRSRARTSAGRGSSTCHPERSEGSALSLQGLRGARVE